MKRFHLFLAKVSWCGHRANGERRLKAEVLPAPAFVSFHLVRDRFPTSQKVVTQTSFVFDDELRLPLVFFLEIEIDLSVRLLLREKDFLREKDWML